MGEVIAFPSRKIKIDKMLNDALQAVSSEKPLLAQKFRMAINDFRAQLTTVSSTIPAFSFTASGDSILENEATLRLSVLKITDEYNAIITDLFAQIAVLKIENCKLKYE